MSVFLSEGGFPALINYVLLSDNYIQKRMKKLLFWLIIFGGSLQAQSGKIITTNQVKSDILSRAVDYAVYLPPSYDSSQRHYPILYLLHGAWDDHLGWVQWGDLHRLADASFQSGLAPEMIVVMPNGLVDTFYQNSFDGKIRYEDFFFEEFIPEIESRYRVMPTVQSPKARPFRAIAGQSMGGYGALYFTLKHPKMFNAVYTSSAGFIDIPRIYTKPFEKKLLDQTFAKIWGKPTTSGSFEHFRSNSIQFMIEQMNTEQIQSLPPVFIECGDDDYLLDGNIEVATLLQEKKATIEFRVFDGGHTPAYWRDKVDDILAFVGAQFLLWHTAP